MVGQAKLRGDRFVACGRLEKDCPCWVQGDIYADCVDKPKGSEDTEHCMYYGFYLDQLEAEDFVRNEGE